MIGRKKTRASLLTNQITWFFPPWSLDQLSLSTGDLFLSSDWLLSIVVSHLSVHDRFQNFVTQIWIKYEKEFSNRYNQTCVPLNLSTLNPQNRIKRLGIKKTDQHIANTVHFLYVFFLNSFSLRFCTLRETWMRDARNLFTIRIKVITITRRAAMFNDIDRLAKRKISNCYCFSFC